MNDWIRKLENISFNNSIEPIEKGWHTMVELRSVLGTGDNKTRRIVRQALKDNKGKIFIGRQKNTCGNLSKQVWYKLDAEILQQVRNSNR